MNSLSGWVRQSRHRAKRHNVLNTLTMKEAADVVRFYADLCAYCNQRADTMDHAIPLGDGGPNVQANVLTCCRRCKFLKRNHSIAWMYQHNLLSEQLYVSLVGNMLGRSGGGAIKQVLRRESGMVEQE